MCEPASNPLHSVPTMHPTTRLLLTLSIASALLASGHDAMAVDPVWATQSFVYRADGKRLVEVIQDFGSMQGIPVVVDPGVEGTLHASFNNTPAEFMRALTKAYGVVWYFDGVTMFAYPSKAIQTKVFPMRGYKRDQVRQMLTSLGLGDKQYPLRFNDVQQTLVASGPPRHMELVSSVLSSLDQRYGGSGASSIGVVQLRYAFAADRMFNGTKQAGLASTLNGLFNGGDAANSGGSNTAAMRSVANSVIGSPARRERALEGLGYKGSEPGGSERSSERSASFSSDPSEAERAEKADKPFFQAEEATNSIIVRGRAERLAQYEGLVRKLDIALDLVEIEATIIDVNSDEMTSLGIDWNVSGPRGSLSVGSESAPLAGTNVATMISDAGRQLLAKVKALETNGKAKVLSHPKLVGVANRTATMTDKRVASVRVAGNLEANLYSIEAGTSMQFQPQIIVNGDQRSVRLSLQIEDGSFEAEVVDDVPIQKKTSLGTDTTVVEGQSLLIGGISVLANSQTRSGIPLLSRIPGIGALFRSTTVKASRSERLFLLTPKIISVTGSAPFVPRAVRGSLNEPVVRADPPSLRPGEMVVIPPDAPAPVAVPTLPPSAPAAPSPSFDRNEGMVGKGR